MAAMVVGSALVIGFSANAMTRYKGVKISQEHKHADMPLPNESATDRTKPVVEILGSKNRGPTSFHARKYTSLAHEGLGVDHEAWKAQKEAAYKKE